METTYEYGGTFPVAHYGYLDGILGRDPNPRMTGWDEYDQGWLHGDADKANPAKFAILQPSGLTKGSVVTIRKGTPLQGGKEARKTYQVTLHDVYPMRPAHIDHHTGKFVPPAHARILWAGSGGLWQELPVCEVT